MNVYFGILIPSVDIKELRNAQINLAYLHSTRNMFHGGADVQKYDGV
jgi:hypothetical protein